MSTTVKSENDADPAAIVNLVIDPMSLMYLVGATVDYKEGIAGGQYVVINANAQTTCGCGCSFSI